MEHPRSSGPAGSVRREACAAAVARATEVRRRRIHADPQYAAFTTSAITERIEGIPVGPEPGAEPWWRVGWIVNEITHTEFDV